MKEVINNEHSSIKYNEDYDKDIININYTNSSSNCKNTAIECVRNSTHS